MEASNLLLPDGREVLITRDSVPRWSEQTVGWAPTDPATIAAPVKRERYWTWIPGVEIMPYDCTEDA